MLTSSLIAKAQQKEKCSTMARLVLASNKGLRRDELISLLIKTFNSSAAKTEFLSGIDAAMYIDDAIRAAHSAK